MPITKELDNINELESVGFSHEQSKTLTKIIEQAQFDSINNLKEFLRNELERQTQNIDEKINRLGEKINNLDWKINNLDEKVNNLDGKVNNLDEKVDSLEKRNNNLEERINSLDGKFNTLRYELKADIATTSKDLLIKLFAIIFGTSGMLFTMLKLFG